MTTTPRPALYLPSGYKKAKWTTVEGKAATGEVSPHGIVAHTESWDGRVAVTAAPAAIHWTWDAKEERFRPLTHQELVQRRRFIPGDGPAPQGTLPSSGTTSATI